MPKCTGSNIAGNGCQQWDGFKAAADGWQQWNWFKVAGAVNYNM